MARRIPGRHHGRPSGSMSASLSPLESELMTRIRVALESVGCVVTVLAAPHRSHVTPGAPDLYVQHPAWRLRWWLEVKTATGRLSPVQREWHENERMAGGLVLIARSPGEALMQLAELHRARGEVIT